MLRFKESGSVIRFQKMIKLKGVLLVDVIYAEQIQRLHEFQLCLLFPFKTYIY